MRCKDQRKTLLNPRNITVVRDDESAQRIVVYFVSGDTATLHYNERADLMRDMEKMETLLSWQ